MSRFITVFNTTGECVIDVAEVVRHWGAEDFVSQWGDEYTLCLLNNPWAAPNDQTRTKCRISKVQAYEVIGQADLTRFDSPLFRSGKDWKQVAGAIKRPVVNTLPYAWQKAPEWASAWVARYGLTTQTRAREHLAAQQSGNALARTEFLRPAIEYFTLYILPTLPE